jgi:hypothetical protein
MRATVFVVARRRCKGVIMSEWFGKNCTFQCCQWEESEETGGPDYKESEPNLVFCKHGQNPDNFEGNCNRILCPLAKAAPDIYEALKEFIEIWESGPCGLEDFKGVYFDSVSALAKAEGKE